MAGRYPLRWDPGNAAHIRRHQVRPEEVEEVVAGTGVRRRGQFARTILIGPTSSGRMLTVVLELEVDDRYYPVTARPASRKERRQYAVQMGGGSP